MATSTKGNLVVTTTTRFTAQYLLENQNVWQEVTRFEEALPIQSWHKVAIHNIPTSLATNQDLQVLKEEIPLFNNGLKIVGNPFWLTKEEHRASKATATACIAFATEEEALKAIKQKLYILGLSVKAEKLHSTSPLEQCQKCQQFGHIKARC